MNIYICDDSMQEAQIIQEEVKKFSLFSDNEVTIKDIVLTPEKLLTLFRKEPSGLNIFILDIDFHNSTMNGLMLAQKIKEIDLHAYIIFVTSHAELSFLTFEYRIGAIDYIIKDTHEGWSLKIIDCLKTIENRLKRASEHKESNIVLETSNEIKRLSLNDILFFESSKTQKLSVTTLTGHYTINKKTLKSLEEELEPDFWRCHRSYLINKSFIVATDKVENNIILKNDYILPIAIRKKAELKKILTEQ